MEQHQNACELANRAQPKRRRIKQASSDQAVVASKEPPDQEAQFAPKDELMLRQIISVVPIPEGSDEATIMQLRKAVLALYEEIAPRDALESMLAQQLVAMNVAVMAAFRRSAAPGQPLDVRATELNLAIRGSKAFAAMMGILDQRRGIASPKVTVGQVQIQAGGQAIVGHVEQSQKANQGDDDVGSHP